MRGDPTAETVSQAFGRQVRETRKRRGWRQEDLAEELAELGFPIDPTAVVRIERGRRRVTVDEAIAIATALSVAPVHLLCPRERGALVRVGSAVEPAEADEFRQWIAGELPLFLGSPPVAEGNERTDPATYWRERPDDDFNLNASNPVYQATRALRFVMRAVEQLPDGPERDEAREQIVTEAERCAREARRIYGERSDDGAR